MENLQTQGIALPRLGLGTFRLQGSGQIKIGSGTAMGNALQRWLDAHQLPAIAAAVLGIITTLSVLIVFGFYLIGNP